MEGTGEESVEQERDAFIERFLQSVSGAFDIFTVYIGDRLGYYRALAEGGALTSGQLAEHTSTHERYAREWLEQQTVAGILQVEDENADARARRYLLPRGLVEPLVERDSLNYVAPLAQLIVGVSRPLPSLLEAYRRGGGVPLAEYGVDFLEGQAGANRAAFLYQLGYEWLPAMPDVHGRLQSDSPARIADIGCGAGWSAIGMANAYPNVYVDGYDLDAPSVDLARSNVREAGLEERVSIHIRDAGDPQFAGRYDLVTALECIHDMSDPVAALAAMRRLAGENGAVLVVDERVGDKFTARGNDVEWMMYGWSVLHCLPVGMYDRPSVGTGTVMRTETLESHAREAGFRSLEVLPIDNYFFRFYRLHP